MITQQLPDFECTNWPDTWFGVSITPCCEVHDLAVQTWAAHWHLMQCVIDQLGWKGVLIGGVMFAGLIGPPGMIYRALQKRKKQS
jgi:hypothetical protein